MCPIPPKKCAQYRYSFKIFPSNSVDPLKAYEFLKPISITNDEKSYWVYQKQNWKAIKCGHKGNLLKFQLFRLDSVIPTTHDFYQFSFEFKSTVILTHKLDKDYEVVDHFADEHLKGFEIRLKPLGKVNVEDDFDMQ